MSAACRRTLLLAPTLLAVMLLCGCPPPALRIPWNYRQRPWTPVYCGSGSNLLSAGGLAGPVFAQALQPEGAAASPTGTQVAMITQTGELWVWAPLARTSVRLAASGVERQFWPEVSPWSSDGRALVWVQNGNLMHMRLSGQPKQLTTTGDVFTAALSPNGRQVAFGRRDREGQDLGLWSLPATGGEPQQLVPPTHDIFHACAPHWSPDGRWIAFLQAFEGGALGIVSADGKDVRPGIEAAWEPIQWLADSKTVLFSKVIYGESGDGLRSYHVDSKQVGLIAAAGRSAAYALSPDGARVLVGSWKQASDGRVTDARLQLVNLQSLAAEGQAMPLQGSVGACAWAPDGRQVAVLVDDPQGTGRLWTSADGLGGLKVLADASAVIGWARLWQPAWWRFGR